MTIWTARDILDSIDEGRLRIAIAKDEADAEAQRRIEEETASNEAAWAPIIARIKQSIPEWAWEHLTHPNRMPTYRSEHVTMVVPACIDLEVMGQVFAYAHTNTHEPVMFMPAEWHLSSDDETWSVCPFNGRSDSVYDLPGHPDFLIALAQAYENALRIPELMAEAAWRNVERQKAKVEQAATAPGPDWLAGAIEYWRTPGTQTNSRAIACALIGILEQLQKVTTPLYNGSQHAIQTFDNSRGQL